MLFFCQPRGGVRNCCPREGCLRQAEFRRRKGDRLRRNGFSGHADGGSQRGHAKTRGGSGSIAGCELARLRAESRIPRGGASALRASLVRGVDWTRGRGRNGFAGGSDSTSTAIDPGESCSDRAGGPSRGASKELSFFLCVAGPLWARRVSKGDQPHAVCSHGARLGTQ